MYRLGGLLLASLLLLPGAAAEDASGAFVVRGGLKLPSGSDVSIQPLLLFQGGSDAVDTLEGHFERVVVHAYEMRGTVVDVPTFPAAFTDPPTERPVDMTDAEVLLEGTPEEGYVGFYPGDGAVVDFSADGGLDLRWRNRTRVTTAEGSQGHGPYDSLNQYDEIVEGPHLYAEAPGEVVYSGSGAVKILGPDVLVRGREGAQHFRTGIEETQEAPGVRTIVVRWVVLQFTGGSLHVGAARPWIVCLSDGAAQWDGLASMQAVSGLLESVTARYRASPGPVQVEGRFEADLTAREAGLVDLALEGDLASTTLRSESIPVATRLTGGSAQGVVLLAVGIAVAVGGAGFAGGWLVGRRRGGHTLAPFSPSTSTPFTAEDCCDAGAKAASEEDWAAAAKWFRRAHALAPTSARICADLAFALSQIGDVDEALRLYGEASRMSEDGEADFNAALAALHGDRPMEEIESWLERALARSPALVMPLDADSDFRVLQGRPRYEEAVRHAWSRLRSRA